MVKDMTVGNPKKLILAFALPVLLGNIFQQLYNLADTIIVGRFLGMGALAAVGSTGSICFLVLGFAQGVASGFCIVTAQHFGANDEAGVRKSVVTGIFLSIIITVVLTLISSLAAKPLLRLMRTPESIFNDAYTYIIIIFIGMFAPIYYNIMSSILRALGNSKTPLYFLILASVTNIVLDIVFITVFKAGIRGAVLATVISQLLSAILCTVYSLKKYPVLRIGLKEWKTDFRCCMAHLRIGVPMALQFSITAVGLIILQSALNGFGEIAIAGFTAASKVEMLVTQPFVALGVTLANYAGQNHGAGSWERISYGMRFGVAVSLIMSFVAMLINLLLGKYITILFLDEYNAEVVSYATQYLNIIGLCYPFLAVLFCYRNALQGMGESLVPLFGGVGELVARTVIALTLPTVIGYAGVCIAGPAAWLIADVFLIIRYAIIAHGHRVHRPVKAI